MSKHFSLAHCFCWLVVILFLLGCKDQQKDLIRLDAGWEFAIPENDLPIVSSDILRFQPLAKISELTAVAPAGGIILLKKTFVLPDSMLSTPISLMLGRIVKADSTYLNGSFLGATGNFPPNATNPWNINRIYAVPDQILKTDGNELLVKIYFEPGRGGIFDTPEIGERRYLENFSKLRMFYYADTYKISSLISILAAILFFIIFLKRRQDKHFLYFSLAILSFAVWGTYHYIWSLPFLSSVAFFDSLTFQKILWLALFGFGYYNSIFLYEFLDRHKYKVQMLIVKSLLFFTIVGLVIAWSTQFLENFRKIALLGTIILAGFTIFWIVSAIREKVPYAKSVLFFFVVFTILGVTDILIDVFNLYLPYSAPVSIPIYLSGMGIIVINQYVNANNEVERISQIIDVKNIEIEEKNVELTNINRAYGRFVPNEFLKLLNKESVIDIKLGDQIQYDMTVMFSDIRDFTSISEKLSPKETFDFLNGYLEKIGPIIRSNNGFIDKYIGDAIMALFPFGPNDAIKAVIEITAHLSAYNEKRKHHGHPDIRIGTGIHTGSMILGTIGEMERMEGTVISDAVNLTARLEGLTKYYGTPLLLTQSTFEKLIDPRIYHHRKLDKVKLKGKEKPVTLVEIFDVDPPKIIQLKKSNASAFEEALKKYEENKFGEAQRIFQSILKKNPDDITSKMFLERCEKYQTAGDSPQG